MVYCTKVDVRKRLGEKVTALTYDAEIDDCIEEADAEIDTQLKPYTTVPLSSVPVRIKHISADLAAGIFRSRRSPDGLENKFWKSGQEKLATYIKKTYAKGGLYKG
ncbi:MAG: DUF1320 family protein [Desulfobacterales bacterium]|nr:DUF1320 family protein [Desulfobacterales bacterium]